MECLSFITPLPLLNEFAPDLIALLVGVEILPLPFDLSLELLPLEVGIYPVWYVPGDTKLRKPKV